MLPRTALRKDEGRAEEKPHISKTESFKVTRTCKQPNGWTLLQTSRNPLSSGSRQLKISLSSRVVGSSSLKNKTKQVSNKMGRGTGPAASCRGKRKAKERIKAAYISVGPVFAWVIFQLFAISARGRALKCPVLPAK